MPSSRSKGYRKTVNLSRDSDEAHGSDSTRKQTAEIQLDSGEREGLASWFTRLAASIARLASEYFAMGAEQVSSR